MQQKFVSLASTPHASVDNLTKIHQNRALILAFALFLRVTAIFRYEEWCRGFVCELGDLSMQSGVLGSDCVNLFRFLSQLPSQQHHLLFEPSVSSRCLLADCCCPLSERLSMLH